MYFDVIDDVTGTTLGRIATTIDDAQDMAESIYDIPVSVRAVETDTELLAAHLHEEWMLAMDDDGLSMDDVWYRVARRAKELRA